MFNFFGIFGKGKNKREASDPNEEAIVRILNCVEAGDVPAARSLLEQRPDLLHIDAGAGGWLHSGVPYPAMITMLLDMGCDPNMTYNIGKHVVTPAMSAITQDNPTSLAILLERGAKVPQDRAVVSAIVGDKHHSLELIHILQKYGADLHEVCINEYTGEKENALSYAIAYDRDDVVAYLESQGCVLPAEAPGSEGPAPSTNPVVSFFASQFGPVDPLSLVDVVPSDLSIVVRAIPANETCPFVTLFTSGMSDCAMNVPEGEDRFAHAELFLQLPASWPYRDTGSTETAWPLLWLLALARYPHDNQTWLGGPVSIVEKGVLGLPITGAFDSMLLLCEHEIATSTVREVAAYRLFPLYPSERALEAKQGIGALLQLFDKRKVGFNVDVKRPPVA